MKFWLCLLVFILTGNAGLRAQKEDYVWLSGYRGTDAFAGYDSASGWVFGHGIMNFNYTPKQISYDSLFMNFDNTNVSICDSDGNLLFYSNGIYIANSLDWPIDNSEDLNPGYFQYVWDPYVHIFGYRAPKGIIAVRNPGNPSQYYLLHTYIDLLEGSTTEVAARCVLSTLLDMNSNGGLGAVLYKNQFIVGKNISNEIVATRHGNGIDWWAVVQKRNTNCYYKIIINSAGVHLIDSTCENVGIDYRTYATSIFSQDGSKYAIISYLNGLAVFDFDRCSGGMNNSKFIPMPFLEDSFWNGLGVAFSPNNRFLYATTTKLALQYDLWAADLAGSVDTIAVFDGTRSPFGSYFATGQNGPDGKIYFSCGNGETVYHVIERPDVKGDSCLFIQHGVHLPTFSLGVPNFPNYRLGALPGSPCDTLTGLNDVARAEKEKLLKVFPNPATNFVTIDYGFTDWNKGEVTLEISNELGQVVHQQPVPMYSGFQKVEVQDFAPGMYTAFIKRKGQVVATAKFARQ
jgi:hypothetical protein